MHILGINENTSVGDFQYLVNGTVTSFETYINYLESNNKISAGFKNAIIQLYGDLSADKVATEQSYTQIINDYKLSNRYLSSESENVDRYSKMLIASMSFWKTNEQTKGDEMARGCRCGFFCWLCVGIFDAAGTIAGSPVGGAIASFVARCCICSCCKGISNNSSYCNPGN